MMCLDRKYLWPAVAIAALLAWYAYAYHQLHLAIALPFLFLLACPLMHLFMMRGHDHKKEKKSGEAGPDQAPHGGFAGKNDDHKKHDGGHSCCH